jgi:energy-converting hydrogenase B subunit D
MTVATIAPLQALIFVLAPLGATAVVFTRDPLRQIVVNGVYGLLLAILFYVFQAPDVALSMLVVGAVAYPLVVLAAIARVRAGSEPDEEDEG